MCPSPTRPTRKRSPAPSGKAERHLPGPPRRRNRGTRTGGPRLHMDVEWADITKAEGDAFVVGHYMGVLPQNAEWALDCALSRTKEPSRLLLTDLTRRGAIRGALGDLNFFPWTAANRSSWRGWDDRGCSVKAS